MKRAALLFLWICCRSVYGQIIDDFADGNFTDNPVWVTSEDSVFVVSEDDLRLRSNGPKASATIYISTDGVPPLSGNTVTWQFKARYPNPPSNSNHLKIYLLSDRPALDDSPNGYYIRLGENGSDDGIDFFKTGSSEPLIEDTAALVSASIEVHIRLTRDETGNWTLEADNTGGDDFKQIGTANDSEFTFGTYFGFQVKHTSSNNKKFSFDDISVNAEGSDDRPPSVLSVVPLLPDGLTVTFDEAVDTVSATVLTHYSLTNGYDHPVAVAMNGTNGVTLTFGTDLTSADYTLSVNAIGDRNGNILPGQSVAFQVFVPDVAAPNDVVITEIMADPDPVIGLPPTDYIEIYNRSAKTFDLSGWSVADSRGGARIERVVFAPGQYLILCPQSQAGAFSATVDVTGMTGFPNFNNSGDDVILKDETGALIHKVVYEDDWYGAGDDRDGGVSLEAIDPNNTCGERDNWTASEDASGGTPGRANSVFDSLAGVTPPKLSAIRVPGASAIYLYFSKTLDSTTVEPGSFTIVPALTLSATAFRGDALLITLADSIISGTDYRLTVSGLGDCNGNIIETATVPFRYVTNPALPPRSVVITEIMANPNAETSVPDAEYLEIYNNTARELNLGGWQVSDGSATGTLPVYLLEPQGYVVLTAAASTALFAADNVLGLSSFLTLNNSGDAITLKTEKGEPLDSVRYGSSWYKSAIKDDGGYSLEIIDPANQCSDANNWTASEDASGGTPGRANSVLNVIPDNSGPILEKAYGIAPDSIMLVFSEFLDSRSVLSAAYHITPSVDIASVAISGSRVVYIRLLPSSPLVSGTNYSVKVTDIFDCPGNEIGDDNTASFTLIEKAAVGDIVINEILFNPRPGSHDFTEIYNRSQKYISLRHWQLANGRLEQEVLQLDVARNITDEQHIIGPGEYRVFTKDAAGLKDQYPRGEEKNFIEMGSVPSFPDEEGVVAVLSAGGDTLDFFAYSEGFHLQVIDDEEGVSLERIDFDAASGNPDNWMSAAAAVGFATPGYQNSQSKRGWAAGSERLKVDPPVIVPDGNGHDDFATIAYDLDRPGYVASLTIHDIYGRTVKRLARNDLLPTAGFYTWDGTNEGGALVRTGYYIVCFSAFDARGETVEFKKKIAVGYPFR